MPDKLTIKVNNWAMTVYPSGDPDAEVDFFDINQEIIFFSNRKYFEYEPTIAPYPDFMDRFVKWINNVAKDEDQRLLFQVMPHIFYIGKEEFNSLYRVALNGPVARWLIELNGIKFYDRTPERKLKSELDKTWFCPITDSMLIGGFYHINHIKGMEYRPDWYSLQKFGSEKKLKDYIRSKGIKYLVLIEDFVGSGSQMEDAVQYAATVSGIPVLVIPLVICPDGIDTAIRLSAKYANLTFRNIIELGKETLLNTSYINNEPPFYDRLRRFVLSTNDKVQGSPADPSSHYYGPFGYRNTGGLVVMYSNCPDNSVPIIHFKSNSWEPLFPRSSRV